MSMIGQGFIALKKVYNGTNGYNAATIFLYQRANSQPSAPSGTITYNFANGTITGSLGQWSNILPVSNGQPCYVTQTTITSTDTSISAIPFWSLPRILVEDGGDGVSAVSFDVESDVGDTFTDDIETIVLQAVGYDGDDRLTTSDAQFQWKKYDLSYTSAYGDHWNPTFAYGGNDEPATCITDTLSLGRANIVDIQSYKCQMVYRQQIYESVYTVKDTTDIYQAEIRTIGGNVIGAEQPYVLAYVYVTKNGAEVDPLVANIWNDTIAYPEESGDYYRVVRTATGYKVELQTYNASTSRWTSSSNAQDYTYQWGNAQGNDNFVLFDELETKVVALDKTYISRSATVVCNVLGSDTQLLAQDQLAIIDLNDPIVGNTMPQNAYPGQLWVDNTKAPYTMKVYADNVTETQIAPGGQSTLEFNTQFIDVTSVIVGGATITNYTYDVNRQTLGLATSPAANTFVTVVGNAWQPVQAYDKSKNNIFITKPDPQITGLYNNGYLYMPGDLWLIQDNGYSPLIPGSSTQRYPANTMLICINPSKEYNENSDRDWAEVGDVTKIRNEVGPYTEAIKIFEDGLYLFSETQTGQANFYVQLSSSELGFYERQNGSVPQSLSDLSDNRGTKIVWISNSTLHAKQTTVEQSVHVIAEDPQEQPQMGLYTYNATRSAGAEHKYYTGVTWVLEPNGSISLIKQTIQLD